MITNLFFQFLLAPLIVLLLAALLIFVKKKNSLVSNKTLMIFILVNAACMGIAGLFGFMGNNFSPMGYLLAQLTFCGMGAAFVHYYEEYVNKHVSSNKAFMQAMVMAIITVLGGYLMALVFNAVGGAPFGYTAATSLLIFPLPLLFHKTYLALISIPVEIYDVWRYDKDADDLNLDAFEFDRLLVLEIELCKKLNDKDRLRLMVKAPDEIQLGTWFQKFVNNYNGKNSAEKIEHSDGAEVPYGWIFYCKPSFLHKRRLLDPAKNIRANLIKEHITIIAKRVIEHSEEIFYKSNK